MIIRFLEAHNPPVNAGFSLSAVVLRVSRANVIISLLKALLGLAGHGD